MKNKTNGYLPKIAFHLVGENREALEYFTNKHIEEFGEFCSADMMWIFDEAASIKRTCVQQTGEWNSSTGEWNESHDGHMLDTDEIWN